MNTFSKSVLAGFVLSSLGLVSGCGSSSGLGSKPSGASGTMSQELATSLAASGGGASMIVTLSNPTKANGILDQFGKRDGRSALRDCEPTMSGTTTDADGDEIPADATGTFNCTESDGTVTGTFTVSDQDDTATTGKFPLKGLSLASDGIDFSGTLGGQSFTFKVSGSHALTVADKVLTQATGIAYEVTAAGKTVNLEFWVDAVTTADSNATAADIGKSGKMTFTDYLVYSAEGGSFTLKVSATDIKYGECANFFKDGTITFEDGSSNKLEFIYDASCAVTKKFNGTALTAR